MHSDHVPDIETCMELIAGLERENKIQSQLIKAQRSMILTLEKHNQELEDIIKDLSSI